MRALTLYKKYTKQELVQMMSDITNDPLNKSTNSIFMYIPSACKKLSDIAQAITYHMDDDRTKAGNPVLCDGYSGRNSNR